MGRVESIFYKTDENALTYAFLAIISRLDFKIRSDLFRSLQIDFLSNIGELVDIEPQVTLSDKSRPDGLLFFTDSIVVFENKVQDYHRGRQLRNYYRQVATDYDHNNVKLLICVDRDVQGKKEIQSKIDKNRISLENVVIIYWQDIHSVCTSLLRSTNYTQSTNNDVSLFLLNEFVMKLNEMGLDEMPYEGMKIQELQGYIKSSAQIKRLERILKKQVPREFEELDNYRANDVYSSLFKNKLAFNFKKAYGLTKGSKWTYVFIKFDQDDGKIILGIQSGRERDLRKIGKSIDLRELAKQLSTLSEYSILYGPKFAKTINGESVSKIYKSLLNATGLFNSALSLRRVISLEELERDFKIDSQEFPVMMMEELNRLRNIIRIFDDLL